MIRLCLHPSFFLYVGVIAGSLAAILWALMVWVVYFSNEKRTKR